MACNSGNQTLDPFQNILDSANKATDTLENQAKGIVPDIDLFDNLASSITEISPTATVNNALSKMTADALCAGTTNLAPINDLAEDCLNESLKGVKKYINDMLGNIEDGIDLIAEILALPENALMKQFQKLWKLCDSIGGLVNGIDTKIQCIALSEQAVEYQDQIDYLQDRVSTVTDDLKLADDGSFDPDILMADLDSDLKDNVNLFKERSDTVQTDITDGIASTVDLGATLNPKRKF